MAMALALWAFCPGDSDRAVIHLHPGDDGSPDPDVPTALPFDGDPRGRLHRGIKIATKQTESGFH